MSRLTRINTIWRKELVDTLRDRRTLIAMVLVPLALYPAMMLGSLQGVELRMASLARETYKVAVTSEDTARWLRALLDQELAHRPGAESLPAEEIVARAKRGELPAETNEPAAGERAPDEAARARVRAEPPDYEVHVIPDVQQLRQAVLAGSMHAGLLIEGPPPCAGVGGSTPMTVIYDETEVRSFRFAAAGLEGVLQRLNEQLLRERLAAAGQPPEFVRPIELRHESVAPPEKVGGSLLGIVVPLILIIMTITGAIYPAIDLTAGERERGTLETLMVAPVPTVDLIAGKFVVVALIGMLSAALNLLSIGGTIWLGGLGELLARGGQIVIPLGSLPWVLLVLVPLAVMFSAVLLAVCSFARSFKEAQNYVMPVMIAALIPAIVGVLPGTRLEGPLLIMPVTNIVILTRDLFTGKFDLFAILWVTLSSTLYAGAAVAIAAKLFGQEAVLFADSGSFKTLLRRRFYKPADQPTAAQAFLLLALVFSLNFFAQQKLLSSPVILGTMKFWWGFALILVVLFVGGPVALALWMRVRLPTALRLQPPPAIAWLPAACFGLSTWILAQAWFAYQQTWLPMPPEMEQLFERMVALLGGTHPALTLLFLALLPAVCEELFFRGYCLSGLRGGLGRTGAVLVTAFAFGVYHHSVHRLIVTAALGVLFGLLVLRYGSLWPAVLAHLLHNGISVMHSRADGLKPLLERLGFALDAHDFPSLPWTVGAALLTLAGLLLCAGPGGRRVRGSQAAPAATQAVAAVPEAQTRP